MWHLKKREVTKLSQFLLVSRLLGQSNCLICFLVSCFLRVRLGRRDSYMER